MVSRNRNHRPCASFRLLRSSGCRVLHPLPAPRSHGHEAGTIAADLAPPGYAAAASIIRDAFSPIMIDGALVLPDVKVGMIEASATRNPSIPCTRN